MKKLLLIAAVLALTACGTQQQLQATSVQGCAAYKASLDTAINLLEQGKLNPVEIHILQIADRDVTPICSTKTLPADPAAATAKVTAAVTTLTVQIIADKVKK